MLKALLLACWAPVLHTYFFYPLLLFALRPFARDSGGKRPPDGPGGSADRAAGWWAEGSVPHVTIVIAAYNEEGGIGKKIENCLALDYPRELLEIIVISDGSSDRTVEVARAAARAASPASGPSPASTPATLTVLVIDHPGRRGKTACLNQIVPTASGEIVVQTDANSVLARDSLRHIVVPFRDPRVGCVVGELEYTNMEEPAVAGGEGLYWRYENFVKEGESRLGSTITANGGIYAIRRRLFEPLPVHIEADAADPLRILRLGYRAVFEREARAYERAASTLEEEFWRKYRIITRGLYAYAWARGLLFPLRPWLAFQLASHKLLRWLAPLFLAGALVLNILLLGEGPFYALLLAAQIAFYAFGLLGVLLAARGGASSFPSRAAVVSGYFCVVNAAAARATWDFARGVHVTTWEKSASTRSV